MKKTQTIVDRERLSSDYIESKQDFGHVLSQVKLLPTANWKSPWFYGPIGIAVLSVTVSIVSFNPSNAIASTSEKSKKELNTLIQTSLVENKSEKLISEIQNESISEVIKEENPQASIDKKSTAKLSNEGREEDVVMITSEEKIIEEKVESKTSNATPFNNESKIPSNNKFPYIDGYYTGKIPLESLFDKKGILISETVQVVSFDINFFTGRSNVVNQVRGNKIPEEMRSMITNFNIGKTIFITNIKAYDRDGRIYTLPSMNFIPVVDE